MNDKTNIADCIKAVSGINFDMHLRLFAIVIFFLTSLTGAENRTAALKLGYVDFPPYTYTDKDGNAAGIYIERAKKLFQSINRKFEAQSLPPKRLYQHLAEGKIDFFMGINTSELIKEKTISSKQRLGAIELNAFFIKNREQPPKEMTDITSMNIGIIRGYSYGSIHKKLSEEKLKNTIQYVTDHKSGFGMLKLGRIDVFLDYAGPSAPYLKADKESSIASISLLKFDCFFVMNKQAKDAQGIIDGLDVLLKKDNKPSK